MSKNKDRVLLIDGHNALWRASVRYGKPVKHVQCTPDVHKEKHIFGVHCACGSPWNISDNKCYGEMYHLVYSFFRNLKPILEKFEPDKCYFVLEGHPKHRYDLYPEYKANRIHKIANTEEKEKLDKFYEQKNIVLDLLNYLPITQCRAADFEADDVIGELCETMRDEELIVLSNDSDYIQLLQKGLNIKIYNPIKKEFMVAPDYHYICWKSLNGDKSDNIPKLLTPKKAINTVNSPELLKKFLSVSENKFLFDRNRELIEFKPVPLDNLEVVEGISNFNELKKRFQEMQFKSSISEPYWSKFVSSFKSLKL